MIVYLGESSEPEVPSGSTRESVAAFADSARISHFARMRLAAKVQESHRQTVEMRALAAARPYLPLLLSQSPSTDAASSSSAAASATARAEITSDQSDGSVMDCSRGRTSKRGRGRGSGKAPSALRASGSFAHTRRKTAAATCSSSSTGSSTRGPIPLLPPSSVHPLPPDCVDVTELLLAPHLAFSLRSASETAEAGVGRATRRARHSSSSSSAAATTQSTPAGATVASKRAWSQPHQPPPSPAASRTQRSAGRVTGDIITRGIGLFDEVTGAETREAPLPSVFLEWTVPARCSSRIAAASVGRSTAKQRRRRRQRLFLADAIDVPPHNKDNSVFPPEKFELPHLRKNPPRPPTDPKEG